MRVEMNAAGDFKMTCACGEVLVYGRPSSESGDISDVAKEWLEAHAGHEPDPQPERG